MRTGKHLSLISIVFSIIVVFVKLHWDISTYYAIQEALASTAGDISPAIFAGGFKVLIFLALALISLVLSIIGMKKKNYCRKLALSINIFAVIYLIIPVGLLATM
ncbi:hypothetical protein GCM10009122_48200 [Fulvivirga kasyanovii]|uniref:Uncharacterized protein n=1 Tax=Fulvivirga kasyanovii TaxID=396812 RepID=A0ABW9RHT7_9BACT|nr:hypothetical protein [Fulvivirga kasyanovii]MTI23618.1 hypothetical protein [Fulvivirga kasyanovii]